MKRILGLAYLLVWMWREHVEAAKLKNTAPSQSLVLIFDEVEAHLHPQWQRVLLPALLRVVRELSPEIEVQILATTHAPLVLASLEPHFDDAMDALFHFDLDGKQITVSKVPWRARGDASSWLTSDVFELGEARSVEAERAITEAKAAMRKPNLPIEEARRIHHALHEILKDTDPFWPRWLLRARQAGVEP
jgi:AAA domain, putative AbiEii toxin, Type IV TA system